MPQCDSSVLARGLCVKHYNQQRRANQSNTCSVDACEASVASLGLCNAHYLRSRKHGDPLGGGKTPRKPVDHADGTRTCNDCGERLPPSEFPKDQRAPRGLKSWCKSCHVLREMARYKADPDTYRARVRDRRVRDGERIRAYDIARYERDKEKRIALATDAVHARRARLAKTHVEKGITVQRLRELHGTCCCYCGVEMTWARAVGRVFVPTKATIEHVVPISRGGAHSWENTRLACWSCNLRKNRRLVDEWRRDARSTP